MSTLLGSKVTSLNDEEIELIDGGFWPAVAALAALAAAGLAAYKIGQDDGMCHVR